MPKDPSTPSKNLGHYLTHGGDFGDPLEADGIGDALVDLAVQKTLERLAENAEKGAKEKVGDGQLAAYYARVDATCELDLKVYRDPSVSTPPHALIGASMLLPPCGCDVVGGGLSKDPIRIVFCARHRTIL
jgi:hypothetical protein